MKHQILNCPALFTAALLAAASAFANPEVPGAPQKKPVALTNATIHPITSPPIEKGTLLFDGGKITALGANVEIPESAEKIDLRGQHIYPGLFEALSDVGLVEINSIRATIDAQETGQLNPNVRAVVAVNPDSEIIPVTRSNGVLLSLTAPYGGLMSGRSGVIQHDGWTWEDMTLKADVALHIQWPQSAGGRRGRGGSEESPAAPDRGIESLRQALTDARAYLKARDADRNNSNLSEKFPRDSRWESLADVLSCQLPIIVHADDLKQINAAVAFAEREGLKLIIAGGYDAPRCADLLKKNDIPVIVGGTYRLPRRKSDGYDAAYSVPAELAKAGVRYCISARGRFGANNVRNLPYHAAAAIAFGLPADEALKSITLYPAQILGLANRVGSLETGKDATLFISDGNPLDTPTQITSAYISGRQIDLNDRHKTLYHKYEQKYKQQQ